MKKTVNVFLLGLLFVTSSSCDENEDEIIGINANAIIYSGVHDPAQLVEVNNELVLFASAVEWSTYKFGSNAWELKGDDIYAGGGPSWYNGTNLWAPSVWKTNPNELRLYHSAVSDEVNHRSRIGFVTVSTLTSGFIFTPSMDYVLESQNTQQPFAIDPAVFEDDFNRTWLVYGSHANGIWMVELDQKTGLLKRNPKNKTWDITDDRFIEVANYGGTLDENNIEAAYIYNHPGNSYYYLFVNWDVCCSGINSTYNIRVGRSYQPTGPFVDRNGVDLKTGGGTLFLDANGEIIGNDRFQGPGHSGIYQHSNGKYYFSHHFYDENNNGEPSLAIWNLSWIDDWPILNTEQKINL
ncbi:arabinan endo-1,5-alpha-L-arabinosidase [Cyclobacterium xiamenense]|uniref:arabinan endo-1,5-alpha-L-arabinosidase n=1 Tax=Cyclobacterium xiamenense TaxID=1297121 RepID=UPI0035CF79D4